MHMEFLYTRERDNNPQVADFLDQQAKIRQEWMKELKISTKEAERIYGLLEWCDAFSLLLCQNDVQPEHRIVEVSQGPDKKQYKLMEKDRGILTVSPWSFEENSFELLLETRIIPQLKFKDCDEFKKLFLAAEVIEKSWQLEK
jgi:hypothetical protein